VAVQVDKGTSIGVGGIRHWRYEFSRDLTRSPQLAGLGAEVVAGTVYDCIFTWYGLDSDPGLAVDVTCSV
jgi:hypothetical protein